MAGLSVGKTLQLNINTPENLYDHVRPMVERVQLSLNITKSVSVPDPSIKGKLMLQLLFTCRCKLSHTDAQVELIQRDVWKRCEDRKLGGFFLRTGGYLIGLFEGSEKSVVGQVEHLIRKHKVESVHVVREARIAAREWTMWNKDLYGLEHLSSAQRHQVEGLAQIVEIAVDAERKESQQH